MRGEPVVAAAGVMLHQPEARHAFSRGSCPWITGPWQWRAAPAQGGAVWRVTCARTQASWWRQQQPYHLMPVSGVHTNSHRSRPSLELI